MKTYQELEQDIRFTSLGENIIEYLDRNDLGFIADAVEKEIENQIDNEISNGDLILSEDYQQLQEDIDNHESALEKERCITKRETMIEASNDLRLLRSGLKHHKKATIKATLESIAAKLEDLEDFNTDYIKKYLND